MTFFRRWLLLGFTLLLGGGPLLAASREELAYAAGVQAFHDQFYSLAASRLTQYLQNPVYRRSTNAPMAVLLLAQADYYQMNYAAVTNRLTDPANLARASAAGLADRYEYWRAEAEYAQGNLDLAAHTFAALADHFPHSPLALEATVEAAAAFAATANWAQVDQLLDNPNGLFHHLALPATAGATVNSGWLLLAQSKLARQDFAAALEILRTLDPARMAPAQKWNREYLLFQASLGLNDLDAAWMAATNQWAIARAGQGGLWATNLAESFASQATVLERQGRLAEAMATLRTNVFSSTTPAGLQAEAMLKLADLALANTNLPAAESELEDFLRQSPDSAAAALARLTLGELHLKQFLADPAATNQLATAQADLFAGPTNSPLAGRAWLARGWWDWVAAWQDTNAMDTNALAQSFSDYSQAALRLPPGKELAVARFKMGDAQFALADFSGAQTNYLAVLSDFAAVPEVAGSLRGLALYQLLRVRLALPDEAGANQIMDQLLAEFATNDLTQRGLLLTGERFSQLASTTNARALFEQFESRYTNSWLLPRVKFALGQTYEREGNWQAVATNYEAWLREYPRHELRPEVEFARALAVAQTGDEERALKLFSGYPTNILYRPSPGRIQQAYWWLADHYFRLGDTNLTTAELDYQLVFQDITTNELAYRAQLMAARAAMGRGGYRQAIRSYLDPLVSNTNCPEALKMEAKFAYCEAERETKDTNNASLQIATNILLQICAQYPTNEAGARAWAEMGDCAILLNDLDAATNAYAQALQSPGANPELSDRVQVGWGLVLEKKAEAVPDTGSPALLAAAMQNYEAVFDPEGAVNSEFWRKEAGLRILKLNAKTGLLTGPAWDDFVTKFKRIFPQLQNSTELQRLTAAKQAAGGP